jgi:peptidoglycan/xylan/chitin deacetylase (PgdA/CDA1 family)
MTAGDLTARNTKAVARRTLLLAAICLASCVPPKETARPEPGLMQLPPKEAAGQSPGLVQPPTAGEKVILVIPTRKENTTPTREEIFESFAGRKPIYWGLEAPGVLRRATDMPGVALTLDFCGGPGGNAIDTRLLNTLRQNGIPATLFLNSRWIAANPSTCRELANNPLFELANHGTGHLPLSVTGRSAYGIPGTLGPGEVYDEIVTNNAVLEDLTGRRPRFFRPGTAYLDDISAQIVRAVGLIPVGFSINGDGGATFPAPTVAHDVSAAAPGDIVIAHGNHPEGGTAQGLIQALAMMQGTGRKFVHLPSTITG